MSEERKKYLRLRLDEDLRRVWDLAQSQVENKAELLKIFLMCGINQELREIHRTSADQHPI